MRAAIVDKTAKFVARGAEYLTRMREDKANDPKFSFLKEGDPYHAYFLMRVSEGPQGICHQIKLRPNLHRGEMECCSSVLD